MPYAQSIDAGKGLRMDDAANIHTLKSNIDSRHNGAHRASCQGLRFGNAFSVMRMLIA